MKIKTFFGKNVQDAMNRAKAELGDGVILFETKEIKQNLKSYDENAVIQITAGADITADQPIYVENTSANPEVNDLAPRYFNGHIHSLLNMPESKEIASSDMASEIAGLREDIQKLHQKLSRMDRPDFVYPYSIGFDKLVESGVRPQHASEIMERIRASIGDQTATPVKVMGLLKTECVRILEGNPSITVKMKKTPRIVMLAGPSGVGKTTTIMKMSINPEIFPNRKVSILTTDTYRMAASAPLLAFSKVSEIPVYEIKQAADALALITQSRDDSVFIVDTPGRSCSEPDYIELLKAYVQSIEPDELYLTLSAVLDLDDMENIAKSYLHLKPNGLIITKLDETSKTGKLISLTRELNLPIRYISTGQAIPHDIYRLSRELIKSKLLMMI